MREYVNILVCVFSIQSGLWKSLPPFRPLVMPPHRELVSSGDIYIFFVVSLSLLFMREVGVSG